MLVGYARTSTADQVAGLEAQLRDLKAAGCDRIFQEQRSAVTERPALSQALQFVREGDKLVVTKLDRWGGTCGLWRRSPTTSAPEGSAS